MVIKKNDRAANVILSYCEATGIPTLSKVELSTFGVKRRLWADYLDRVRDGATMGEE